MWDKNQASPRRKNKVKTYKVDNYQSNVLKSQPGDLKSLQTSPLCLLGCWGIIETAPSCARGGLWAGQGLLKKIGTAELSK